MSLHSERYFELVERFGGVNPEALDSLVYWNNPLALKHWTMNIAELIYISGAVLALYHAIQQYRTAQNGSYLAFLLSMIIYCFVIEVPIYFPQLIGLPPDVIFIHNEFSLGFVFNQTPLYIICLYPAMLYSSYVLIDKLGIFDAGIHGKKTQVLVGAICVGFVHSCLYEIFDHFGIQYNWWIWDYNNPNNALLVKGVPLLSIANFSLIPPIAMTLLARWLLFNKSNTDKSFSPKLLLKSLVLGVLTPLVMFCIAPTTLASMLSSNPTVLTWVSWLTLAVCALITCIAMLNATGSKIQPLERKAAGSMPSWARYPFNYFAAYLAAFAALWLYALDDYFKADAGITSFNTYIGSLPYVLACFAFAIFILYRFKKTLNN